MALGNNIGIASERGKNKATRFGSVPPLEVWASGASSRPVGAAACGAPIPTINTPLYLRWPTSRLASNYHSWW